MPKFELFYPYRPHDRFQKFGESLACAEDKPDIDILKRKVVTKVDDKCPAGYTELYPLLGMKGHTGEDLYAPNGAPLRAPFNGVVAELQTEPARGLGIGIVTEDRRDLGQYGVHYVKCRQWHLKSLSKKLGERVRVGDILGYADSTGLSSASHNHLEIKAVEYDEKGNLYNVFQNNGFYGSISPEEFWNGQYAEAGGMMYQIIDTAKKVVETLMRLLKR